MGFSVSKEISIAMRLKVIIKNPNANMKKT